MTKKNLAAHGSNKKRPKRLRESGNYSKRNELERLVDLPKVQVYNGRRDHSVNTDLKNIWQRQELEWVDERLRTQLEDMLRGLDRKMAQEVIGCILFFINWGPRNYLDLWHIDGMLKTAYNKIEHAAAQQGIKLPLFP